MRAIEAAWEGASPVGVATRAALLPLAAAYRGATALRNRLYDRGILRVVAPAVPVVSVGNLAVGGAGKTPVSSWVASQLQDRGARPAIVLRGYGDDEPRVHAILHQDIPVHVNADRAAAVRAAAAGGCDVAVLDDGFQHRRIGRVEDIVLVSADTWRLPLRLLPAGPWREGTNALGRATLVMVTRKAAPAEDADRLLRALAPLTDRGEGAVVALPLDTLRRVRGDETLSLDALRGARVLAIAGIADPTAFAEQLRAAGAAVTLRGFPDHHVYETSDAARLARDATSFTHVVCTLKDAVKLGSLWPREAEPPWYVSQRCEIDVGGVGVSALLDRVLAARSTAI